MIRISTPQTRKQDQELLERYHRFRYEVTHDVWGWQVPDIAPGRDRDRFDHHRTIHIIVSDDSSDRIIGSARLNPSTGPHMLSEPFRSCCNIQEPPSDPYTYEFSRYIVDPRHLSRRAYMKTLGHMELALTLMSLRAGVERLTWFSYRSMYSRSLRNWRTEPLGLPKHYAEDGEDYIPAVSFMDRAALQRAIRSYSSTLTEIVSLARAMRPAVDCIKAQMEVTERCQSGPRSTDKAA